MQKTSKWQKVLVTQFRMNEPQNRRHFVGQEFRTHAWSTLQQHQRMGLMWQSIFGFCSCGWKFSDKLFIIADDELVTELSAASHGFWVYLASLSSATLSMRIHGKYSIKELPSLLLKVPIRISRTKSDTLCAPFNAQFCASYQTMKYELKPFNSRLKLLEFFRT